MTEPKTIDLTPTDDAYRHMARWFVHETFEALSMGDDERARKLLGSTIDIAAYLIAKEPDKKDEIIHYLLTGEEGKA